MIGAWGCPESRDRSYILKGLRDMLAILCCGNTLEILKNTALIWWTVWMRSRKKVLVRGSWSHLGSDCNVDSCRSSKSWGRATSCAGGIDRTCVCIGRRLKERTMLDYLLYIIISFLKKLKSYWSLVNLLCYISFRCTAKQFTPTHMYVCVCVSCSAMSDSLQLHGL